MRTEVIKPDSIDSAIERILDELKEDKAARSISSRNNNVIYFDGWDGLGASTVLRAVAQRLAVASEAPAGLKFDQIIHIDCSKWESRRVLQRAIAEQLELPATLMDLFDKQDEEDEFNGVSLESRLEIPQVLRGMHRRIQDLKRRFLVIFHNGSNEEIDLASFGFHLSQYLDNKVLWTFQGRFRLYPRNKVVGAMKKTDVFISARHILRGREPQELCTDLVRHEAAEVIAESGITISTSNGPAHVGEHFLLHMLKLCCMGHNISTDYDLATHACNYWICDGIILPQGDDTGTYADADGLWRAAGALQREMRLDVGYYQNKPNKYFPSPLVWFGKCVMPDRTSPNDADGFLAIPTAAIPNADMFQDFNRLSVLKLSHRTFSFSSPPFIYCHNLKFLWLDHCQDQEEEDRIKTDGAGIEDDFQRCFQRLWVLDVRYTRCDQILSARMLDFMTQLRELNVMGAQVWDICQLQGRLPSICKLRVSKSTLDCSEHNLFLGMSKMELLDLSGNQSTQAVEKISGVCTSSNQLVTVRITHGSAGIQKFSFTGCAKLRNVLLSGLFEDLHILDLSGTAIRTLDLSAMTAHDLGGLFLDNCRELYAILWPPEDGLKSCMQKLHIDTTRSAASSSEGGAMRTSSASGSLSAVHGGKVPSEFDWCIVVRDARLLRSLATFMKSFKYPKRVHVEISSCVVAFGSGKDNDEAVSRSSSIKQQQDGDGPANNWICEEDHLLLLQQAGEGEGDGDAPWVRPCPCIPCLDDLTCYMHIQQEHHHQVQEQEGEATTSILPDIVCHTAGILHVHDSLSTISITCPDVPTPTKMLSSSVWGRLVWCRVERCPNLGCVFTDAESQGGSTVMSVRLFSRLKTFWGSCLLKALRIWFCSRPILDSLSFEDLTLLHLDFCPRLICVLWLETFEGSYSHYLFQNLQTLEIAWCGALREVFSLYAEPEEDASASAVIFENLKHIHLRELPMLQGICGGGCRWWMYTPSLETIKIRGCWSLKRLPFVMRRSYYSSKIKKAHCDCEKEWWDGLEWTGSAHRSCYEPTHPRYYKKTLLKGSVLK